MLHWRGLLLLPVLVLAGCDQPAPVPETPAVSNPAPAVQMLGDASRARLQQLRTLGTQWLAELSDCAAQLEDDTRILLEKTSPDNLTAARQRWQSCFDKYRRTELLVGMSDSQAQSLDRIRLSLASPLDMPGYIDSIEGYEFSGIVNDASLPLTQDTLRQQQGLIDVEDVSLGFNVIGFLLWGEFRFNPALPPRTSEQLLAVKQWDDQRTDLPVSEHPQNRRRLYLQLATALLKEDCAKLATSWNKGVLPLTEAEARQWQTRQLQRAIGLLDQYPDSVTLPDALVQWLTVLDSVTGTNASPSTPATAPVDTDTLRNRIQATLTSLLTTQG